MHAAWAVGAFPIRPRDKRAARTTSSIRLLEIDTHLSAACVTGRASGGRQRLHGIWRRLRQAAAACSTKTGGPSASAGLVQDPMASTGEAASSSSSTGLSPSGGGAARSAAPATTGGSSSGSGATLDPWAEGTTTPRESCVKHFDELWFCYSEALLLSALRQPSSHHIRTGTSAPNASFCSAL